MPPSKTLGILGLGNFSTLHFVEKINIGYNNKHCGYSTCPFVMLNANFNDINPFLPDNYTALETIVNGYLNKLNALGCDCIAIPNITLNKCIDVIEIDNNIRMKIINPLSLLKDKMADFQSKNYVVFGTKHSMQLNYFSDYTNGVNQLETTKVIFNSIEHLRQITYLNGENKDAMSILENHIKFYKNKATIIIACTELSVLYSKLGKREHCIDLLELQSQSILSIIE